MIPLAVVGGEAMDETLAVHWKILPGTSDDCTLCNVMFCDNEEEGAVATLESIPSASLSGHLDAAISFRNGWCLCACR